MMVGSEPRPLLLDTSVIVRYLTDDPPPMAEAASRLIDGERPLEVIPLILAESAYVLTSVYGVPRAEAADALADLVLRRNIGCRGLAKSLAVEALRLAGRSGGVSFSDALLWATARDGGRGVATFDRRFPAEGIDVEEPGG